MPKPIIHKIFKSATISILIITSLSGCQINTTKHSEKNSLKYNLNNTLKYNLNNTLLYKNKNQHQKQKQKQNQKKQELAYLNLAKAQLLNGQLQQAKKNLFIIYQLNPNNSQALAYLGYYFSTTGEPKLATQYFRKAINLSPNQDEIANIYGVFLCKHGQYLAAVNQFDKIIKNHKSLLTNLAKQNKELCTEKQEHKNITHKTQNSTPRHQ